MRADECDAPFRHDGYGPGPVLGGLQHGAWRVWYRNAEIGPITLAVRHWVKVKNRDHPAMSRMAGFVLTVSRAAYAQHPDRSHTSNTLNDCSTGADAGIDCLVSLICHTVGVIVTRCFVEFLPKFSEA